MEKFRISNDLSIFWSITNKDGSPYTLSDKTVRLFVTHPRGRMDVTQDITIQDNVICWLFRGSRQRYLGTYRITAEIQATPADRIIRKDIPEAFELVSSTQYEQTEIGRPDINEEGELTLATSLDIFQIKPIIPQVGPNRNWWVDGVDTGKSSVGLTAYEFAKEQGYEGTEEEYAAECLAVPVLNEESRTATEEARTATEEARSATEESETQLQSVSDFMSNVAAPTITRAELAAEYAEQAKQEADAATAAATEAAAAAESAISNIAPILNEKQDKLVSGRNIKTLNGQSLLGEGDVEMGMTHVTDFTVEDLSNLYHGLSDYKQCDLLRLQNSLANKEIILVPYGPGEVKGYSLLHGYSDDLLYFSVTDERGNIYSVETDKNAREIYSENITFISPVTNKSNIADLQAKDAEQAAKLAELSEKVNELDKGEAYIMGDTLTFRNYADASIEGETLKL